MSKFNHPVVGAVIAGALALGLGACLPPPAPRPYYGQLPVPQVTVTADHLELNQAIYFEFNSDRLMPVSYPILDEVARTLMDRSRIERVRIEGHTDNVGTPTYNQQLSARRALSVVRYLEGRGVPRARLRPDGLGQSQPIADNNSEEGRARNRRVVFLIEQWQRSAMRR